MDNGGNTQLHLKSYMGTPSEVKSLLDARADVNISGDTPLHLALKSGKQANVKLLLDAGADINQANNDGITPLNLALAIVKPTKRTGGKTKKKRRRRRKSRK